ncbi:MAG: hypothetical protein V3W41_18865 [Planctomycetota bacterium]
MFRSTLSAFVLSTFVLVSSSALSYGQSTAEVLTILMDRDGDGAIGKYEGAAAWMRLVSENDKDQNGKLSARELGDVASKFLREREEMFQDIAGSKRADTVEIETLSYGKQVLVKRIDTNADGKLSRSEFKRAPTLGFREFMILELDADFSELDPDGDGDGDGRVKLRDLDADLRQEFAKHDKDGNGRAQFEEILDSLLSEEPLASFAAEGDRAIMSGVIGPTTPGRVLELVLAHPEVRTIVMKRVSGSMDDDSNLWAARLIHRMGLSTELPEGSEIASGGVDFFLAGVHRKVAKTAKIGVHSWDGGDDEGSEIPKEHPGHKMFLDFYPEIGIDNAFYWYTLKAAPADGIHWMTEKEIKNFGLGTKASLESK